jgi:arylsulfate sulfotransferase
MKFHKPLLLCCLMVAVASPLLAQFTVTLTPNPPAPQPVGATITWTATVSGDPDPDPSYVYTFSAEIAGTPQLVRRGYGDTKTWTWTPNAREAIFEIDATVKNLHAGTQASTSTYYRLISRLTTPRPVNPTNHPLVAFFSAPFCSIPNFMRVRFTPTTVPPGGISSSMTTSLTPCRFKVGAGITDASSMNFYVAGMYPSTTYKMHSEVVDPSGNILSMGRDFPFTTGPIPSGLYFPAFYPTGMSDDPQEPIVLHSVVTVPVNGNIYSSAAVDLAGNILWYSAPVPPVRTEPGGNYWGFSNPASDDPYLNGIRESDPAGNPVLETTLGAINDQLVAFGVPPITSVHHEIRRLITPDGSPPQGDIMVIGNTQYTCYNCQGGTQQNPVDVLGDEIIVMDHNMNVIWAWNPFTNLDVNHQAILNEKCNNPAGGGGCEPFSNQFTQANDWMHSNALQYNAYDGSILLSSRHQDAVFKVNFANGSGDGHIIWELGNPNEPGGLIGGLGGAPLPTFTINLDGAGGPDLAWPWFSHQHDPGIQLGGVPVDGDRIFTVFDDGNTRQAFYNPNADSRCQVYGLNEDNLIAHLDINGDMLSYSFALGSSQLLQNGGIACDSGIISSGNNPLTQSVELDINGNFIYALNAAEDTYRSWRMQDLYTSINP